MGQKTAYQLEYERQQQMLASGVDPTKYSKSIAPPSARMSQLAAQARVGSGGPGRMVRLVSQERK